MLIREQGDDVTASFDGGLGTYSTSDEDEAAQPAVV